LSVDGKCAFIGGSKREKAIGARLIRIEAMLSELDFLENGHEAPCLVVLPVIPVFGFDAIGARRQAVGDAHALLEEVPRVRPMMRRRDPGNTAAQFFHLRRQRQVPFDEVIRVETVPVSGYSLVFGRINALHVSGKRAARPLCELPDVVKRRRNKK